MQAAKPTEKRPRSINKAGKTADDSKKVKKPCSKGVCGGQDKSSISDT